MTNQRDAKTATDRLALQVQAATRDAVNAAALAIVTDARRNVQAVLGATQRLSGAGGARVNPYYKEAESTTRPVALIGVRGPAQYIEHPRRGGYLIRPRVRRALSIDGQARGGARGGPIIVPRRPIGRAFDAAVHTAEGPAVVAVERRVGS